MSRTFHNVQLGLVRPSELNPRKNFDQAGLEALADSIRIFGVQQPIVLRYPTDESIGGYEIVAGERRYRAAKLAGLDTIPAMIDENMDEEQHTELALIENLQRKDLSPLEEANGYNRLVSMGMAQTTIAQRVGRSPSAISNALRLLTLPESTRTSLEDGELSASHAIALCSLNDYPEEQAKLEGRAINEGLTSKELEIAVQRFKSAQAEAINPTFEELTESAPESAQVDETVPADEPFTQQESAATTQFDTDPAEREFTDPPPATPGANSAPRSVPAAAPTPARSSSQAATETKMSGAATAENNQVTIVISSEEDDWLWDNNLTVPLLIEQHKSREATLTPKAIDALKQTREALISDPEMPGDLPDTFMPLTELAEIIILKYVDVKPAE